MKIIITIFISVILLNASPPGCDSSEKYMATGVITGKDMRMCMCCGGYLINLNSNSTEMYTDSTYHFNEVPAGIDLNEQASFPVFVKLDYEKTQEYCGKGIKITRVEKMKE